MAFHYIWAVREAPKLHKKCIFQIGTLMPSASTNAFHLKIFFHVIMFPPIAKFDLSVYIHKPDTTHNSSRANSRNVSFRTLYGGQFTLSTQLITSNFLSLNFLLPDGPF